MNREEAEREAARLNRQDTGGKHRWFARSDDDDEWSFSRVARLAGSPVTPLKGHGRDETPAPQADDSCPNSWRAVGGPWDASGATVNRWFG
jgi:hypothetical protein